MKVIMKNFMMLSMFIALLCFISCGPSDEEKMETLGNELESMMGELEAESEPYEDSALDDDEDDEETTTLSSSSSEDWDSVLDDYDDYVGQYIKFYKKAMEGDMSAMSEYPALMEKATSFAEKFENAKGDLSAKQIGRMAEIQTKIRNQATNNRKKEKGTSRSRAEKYCFNE